MPSPAGPTEDTFVDPSLPELKGSESSDESRRHELPGALVVTLAHHGAGREGAFELRAPMG